VRDRGEHGGDHIARAVSARWRGLRRPVCQPCRRCGGREECACHGRDCGPDRRASHRGPTPMFCDHGGARARECVWGRPMMARARLAAGSGSADRSGTRGGAAHAALAAPGRRMPPAVRQSLCAQRRGPTAALRSRSDVPATSWRAADARASQRAGRRAVAGRRSSPASREPRLGRHRGHQPTIA
jgi:hypothetical protein